MFFFYGANAEWSNIAKASKEGEGWGGGGGYKKCMKLLTTNPACVRYEGCSGVYS